MNFMKHNLKQEYLTQSVMTATPSELIVMLYEACIKDLKLAEISLNDRKDLDAANLYLQKAQKIIMELTNSLDTGYEISAQLLELYGFLLRSIREMNCKKDLSQLPALLEILTSLRDTWKEAGRSRVARTSEVG